MGSQAHRRSGSSNEQNSHVNPLRMLGARLGKPVFVSLAGHVKPTLLQSLYV